MIGYLHSASPEPYAAMMVAFRQGLAEAGYLDGSNVAIDYRWAEGQFNRLPMLAAELVASRPAVLVAGGGDVSAAAAKAATTSTPTVFTIGGDPVGYGLVTNLARPSGNMTGVTFFTIALGPKRLELLRELLPKAARIAMLLNPKSLNPDAKEVQDAARTLQQSVHVLEATSESEIDAAFRSVTQERDEALIVVSNPLFTSRRDQIVTLANYHRVPAIYPLREYAASGGLVTYGELSSRLQHWSVQPCVRPLDAVHMTAGHNALRGSGPGQKPAFDNAMAQVGCPDRRIDRLCITCCSPSQPSHHAGCPARSRLRRKRDGFPVALALSHHGPGHSGNLVGKCDGGDLGRPPGQQCREPGPMFGAVDLGIADDGECAGREQAAQIAVALLADAAEPVLTPARVLLRHEPDPGREVPP